MKDALCTSRGTQNEKSRTNGWLKNTCNFASFATVIRKMNLRKREKKGRFLPQSRNMILPLSAYFVDR